MAGSSNPWIRAGLLSGALLVVPLLGIVLLLALPGGDETEELARPGDAVDVIEAPSASPPTRSQARPPVPPAARPQLKPAPKSASGVLAQGLRLNRRGDDAESEGEEGAEDPSAAAAVEACCAALDELANGGAEPADRNIYLAAARACENGKNDASPSAAINAAASIVEGSRKDLPDACRVDE